VFGTGWAITDACSGTITAMTGTGSLLGFVLLAGVIVGITLRDTMVDTLPAQDAATARS
jgi:hypothetical protein